METLVQADIFFFVTTIAVAVVAIFAVIALIYFINLLSQLKRMAARAEVAGEKIYAIFYFIRKLFKTFI